jgi:signal transduction histidine kinase/integral membrane sensor domain MASE1/CheY-like chemotaxis protein
MKPNGKTGRPEQARDCETTKLRRHNVPVVVWAAVASLRPGLGYAGGLVAIGVIYFLLAKIGLALALINPSASTIWPPTGFALAAIVLWGYRVSPAIFVAAMIANATAAGSIGTAISIATGNSLEALVGAALINIWSNRRNTFSTAKGVAKFAFICVALATPINATVGISSLAIAGYAEWANLANIWFTWWLGDAIGALVVTPVVVLWALSDAPAFSRIELAKSAGVIALAVAVGFIAFSPHAQILATPGVLSFLAVLPLLWAALRRGPRDTAVASLILSGFSIWGTFSGAGLFAGAGLNDSLLLVLVFLVSVSVPSLALSADVATRKIIEENLRRTHTELDRRVEMRTADLAAANQALREEVSRRTGSEKEALEQQTATSEVLRIIASSPGELQPVFRAMLENAVRICEAKEGVLFLHEDGMFKPMVTLGILPAFGEFLSKRGPFRPGPDSTNGRLLRTKQMSHTDAGTQTVPDMVVKLSGARTTLGVPMLKDDVLIGSIIIFRQEVRPFSAKQIALLQHFAAQAVIAIENTRLLGELRARTLELTRSIDELRALGEVSQAVNSTLDLQTVLVTIVATAMQISGTEAGAIYVFDAAKRELQLSATFGMSAETIAAAREMHAEIYAAVGLLAEPHEATPDLREQATTRLNDIILRVGYRAQLLVPLLRSDRVSGVLMVLRRAPGEFGPSTVDLLKTFAAQSALAIHNARLFAEIENKSRQLELANTAKSRFLAMASHDLRQPLHALGLFVAQLRTPLKPGERRKMIGQLDTAVKQMSEMFNSLLDISRLDAGVLVPKIDDFSMARLLQKIETTFDQTAREKGLRLRVVRSDAWVRSDSLLLERILLNLVSNAMRYTLRGGIIVGCRRRGEMLRLEVWDSGPGIPEGHRQNIFGEFFQLPTAERDRYGGLGLGLAIVERLRRLLKHGIELTSTVGRGSRFSILVPIAPEGVTSAEAIRARHPAAFAIEGKVILVIDDAPIVLEGTSGLLGKWGYSVITAGSDEAALIQLSDREQRPDLIISDYHLANGKTGIEAIEQISAATGASIPAILISGDTAPERLLDAKHKGYILLHKPIDPMRLRAVMHQFFKDHGDRRDTGNARGPAELEKSIDERRARLAAAAREIDISETK